MGKILKWQRYEQRLVGDAGSTKRPSKLVFHMMGKGIQWEKKKDQTDGPSAIKKEDNLTAASL